MLIIIIHVAKIIRNRQHNKSKGIEYLRQDKYFAALECFRRAVDITPAMALELIKARLIASLKMTVTYIML